MKKNYCNNYFLIVFGPTGVGKTDFVLELAKHVPSEIINCDVGQFYTPLTVGTAKPDWSNMPIKHHLFDILDTPRNFTVVQYRTYVQALLKEVWAKGKLPIVVGGSGFYLKSLLFPLAMDTHVTKLDWEFPPDNQLWDCLAAIDTERALQIEKFDYYRLKRALSIWYQTGTKPSCHVPAYSPPAPFGMVCLTRDRSELYARINKRVQDMVEGGWIDEVTGLLGSQWPSFIKEKKVIGYNEIFDYIEGKQSPEHLRSTIQSIQKRTRHYAKRQMTFWRMLHRRITCEWQQEGAEKKSKHQFMKLMNLTLADPDLYIEHLLSCLNN